jgi:hypothetical protein
MFEMLIESSLLQLIVETDISIPDVLLRLEPLPKDQSELISLDTIEIA